MNIKKIQLLVTVKGEQVWEKGGVYSAPFPTDLQSVLMDARCIRILEIEKEEINGTEESNKEKAQEVTGDSQEDKNKEKVIVKPVVKLKKKAK